MSTLRKYMTPIPYTIEPGMSVRVAIDLMRRHGIRHLPVERGERLVGILSDWDIISMDPLEAVLDQPVSKLMIRDPIRMTGSATVLEAVAVMNRLGVGSVVVVDSPDHVAGIFTEKDAIRAFAEAMGTESGLTDIVFQ